VSQEKFRISDYPGKLVGPVNKPAIDAMWEKVELGIDPFKDIPYQEKIKTDWQRIFTEFCITVRQ